MSGTDEPGDPRAPRSPQEPHELHEPHGLQHQCAPDPLDGAPGRPSARRKGLRHENARTSDGGQRGSVTAEVAVVLPALVVLLALLLGTAHVGTVQLRLEEAARAGAREAMRGESSGTVQQTVQRLAGLTARVRVATDSGWTTVEVTAQIEGPVVDLMGIELTATASGKEEHGG
ncbi:TadE family type IV pilus minor pilin [Arthrobacter sp. TmT3-37]